MTKVSEHFIGEITEVQHHVSQNQRIVHAAGPNGNVHSFQSSKAEIRGLDNMKAGDRVQALTRNGKTIVEPFSLSPVVG